MKIKILFFLVLFSFAVSLPSKDPVEVITKEETSDWAEIKVGNRCILLNNVWNKNAAKGKYFQRIFTGKSEGKDFFGWSWDWKGTDRGVFNIDEFFDFMIKNKMLKADNYITNIDIGNEIWYRRGTVKIRKYEVIVH